jgi:X-Pro dipeptidyl-peptidase
MPSFRFVLAALATVAPMATAQRVALDFTNGQAQIVPAFTDSAQWIRQRLWVETSFDTDGDGKPDRVHVDVTRPWQTATEGLKVATIYETSPYYAGTSGPRQHLWDVKQEVGAPPPPRTSQPEPRYQPDRTRISNSLVATWVPRGFAVVHSESPGTGLSQGCPTVGGANESLAPKAVIDWLNGRAKGYTAPVGGEEVRADWSTGKVGMTGTSYNGTLPLAAATTGVDGLAAIIPVAPNTSYYHYYRSNGLVRHPGGWLGEDIDFLFDYIHSGDPATRAYCQRTIRNGEYVRGRDRQTGDWNEFWAGRDYLPATANVKAATLMAHAFNDWNVMPEHSVRIVEALKQRGVPVQVYYHQGGHGGNPPLEMMNKWFTRYLYDVPNGVENDPQAFIVREGAPQQSPTPYADYPNPGASAVTLHLLRGGRTAGALSIDDRAGQGRETLIDNVELSGGALAALAESPHRLIYASNELSEAIHLSGTARITIRVGASKPAANLSVWLVALPWEPGANAAATERTNVITRGWADPQNDQSFSRGTPLRPGELRALTFALQPDDQIIPAGKRIALMVMSSDRDFTLWPAPGTELTLDVDGTSLTLPVVGGAEAWRRATARR